MVKIFTLIFNLVLYSYSFSQDSITIKGEISGGPIGTVVYLYSGYSQMDILKSVDSTELVNGRFCFGPDLRLKKGIYTIMFFPDKSREFFDENHKHIERHSIPIFFNNQNVNINADWSDIPFHSSSRHVIYDYSRFNIEGDTIMKTYVDFINTKTKFIEELDILVNNYKDEFANHFESLSAVNFTPYDQINATKNDLKNYLLNQIMDNADNDLGPWMFLDNKFLADFDINDSKKLLKNLEDFDCKDSIRDMAITFLKKKINYAVGSTGIDAILKDTSSQSVQLSQFLNNGKYILLDFWGTGCKPCRAAIPHLKYLYKKYSDLGFEIIAISADNKEDTWKRTLEKEQMPWIQLLDVGAKNGDLLVWKFSFIGTPSYVLIDPKGKIVKRSSDHLWIDRELFNIFKN